MTPRDEAPYGLWRPSGELRWGTPGSQPFQEFISDSGARVWLPVRRDEGQTSLLMEWAMMLGATEEQAASLIVEMDIENVGDV